MNARIPEPPLVSPADIEARIAAEWYVTGEQAVAHAKAIGLKRGQLDVAIADQVVTAVGVAHCAHMKPVEAAAEVDRSNWSKFVDGKPVRDANCKIKKGPYYTPPNLEGLF